MTEYIKFRLTSAKIGVTMALAALIGGVADRAEAQSVSSAKPAPLFVKLTGITGPVRTVLAKIEQKVDVLAKDIASIEKKERTDFYTKDQVGKIYMKDVTANAEFLKKQDTAANAAKLDGLTASQFAQGQGGVASGSVSVTPGSAAQTLLTAPGTNGAIIVVCKPQTDAGAALQIDNRTSSTLPAIMESFGQDQRISILPGINTYVVFKAPEQFHLQTFPVAGFNQVLTLTVSAAGTGSAFQVVGQMLSGNG